MVRRVAFSYKGRIVRTLANLSATEANEILRLLASRLPTS